MLKNIDPLLTPDLLHCLRAMGHGDEIAIVDANFPAASHARRHIMLPGVNAVQALEAVLSVLPLDDFVPTPAHHMQVVDKPAEVPEICEEFQTIIQRLEQRTLNLGSLERFAFYERVRGAYVVVSTGETRLYGNIILAKGIIRP